MISTPVSKIQAIKGMPDILPKQIPLWHEFESIWRKLMLNYAYEEIRFPIVEKTQLFKRSIGEVTDIVEKEMFTFQDKDNENITLRPEGTAGCVRAGIEHGLFYNTVQRLWYIGPMFRYEKPQKGRYRQFHHVGVEAFGFPGPDIEIEHILMTARLWKMLGVQQYVKLEINTLGSKETRDQYRTVLVQYFSKYESLLDEDSKRRLQSNPLRILDSKNPNLADLIHAAPKCYDFLDEQDKAHFAAFQQGLKTLGIEFTVNPYIVRGLDYYNQTVYEWVTDKLGAQNAVGAGGRYNALVEQLGGENTNAVGFALGIERVILLLETVLSEAQIASKKQNPDIYVMNLGREAEIIALKQAEILRDQYPNLQILVHCGGGSFKTQFKRADKSGAKIALILGEEELKANTIGVKFLREAEEQVTIPQHELVRFLFEVFSREG